MSARLALSESRMSATRVNVSEHARAASYIVSTSLRSMLAWVRVSKGTSLVVLLSTRSAVCFWPPKPKKKHAVATFDVLLVRPRFASKGCCELCGHVADAAAQLQRLCRFLQSISVHACPLILGETLTVLQLRLREEDNLGWRSCAGKTWSDYNYSTMSCPPWWQPCHPVRGRSLAICDSENELQPRLPVTLL